MTDPASERVPEMVERVARNLSGTGDPDGHEHYHVNPEYWQKLARAAIATLRDPTTSMIDAGDDAVEAGRLAVRPIWQKMIDEALR